MKTMKQPAIKLRAHAAITALLLLATSTPALRAADPASAAVTTAQPTPAAAVVRTQLTLPRVFSDNMVLQRDRPVPVWGWAPSGEKVTVAFAGQTKTATADTEGKWTVTLDPLPGCKEGRELTVTSTLNPPPSTPNPAPSTLRIQNVLVGEVWLCSGQSNMEWLLSKALNAEAEIAAADHPLIRHFRGSNKPSLEKLDDYANGGWAVCSPKTAGNFTAAGYFFAIKLAKELDLPIGLLNATEGSSSIDRWICPEGVRQFPDSKEMADMLKRVEDIKAEASSGPADPAKFKQKVFLAPISNYNKLVSPLVPYGIRGVIWYQGESGATVPTMKALVGGWREIWKQGDFPFYYVQIAGFYGKDKASDQANLNPEKPSGYAGIREVQLQALSINNSGMAVAIDIGEETNIHPSNKQDVGDRLARWALAKDYGKNIPFSGPLYKEHTVEGNKIRITFDHAEEGLFIGEKNGLEPPREVKDGKITWITIADKDLKKFVFAEAKIEGNSLVVWSDEVPEPAYVRYHMIAYPTGLHLYNRAGLPASPFRWDEKKL
jgi:sialate O-acetylesterase